MPVDFDSANWNKENIWPLPISTFINPSINVLDNEKSEDNQLENERFCINLKMNKKLETVKDNEEEFSIKRGRFETNNYEENEEKITEKRQDLILPEKTEGMVNLCCWWSQHRNHFQNVKASSCQIINISSSASKCLFPVTLTKEEPQKLEQSSKNARIVLGELFNYVLSPFKYSDEDEDDELPTCSSSISTLYNGKQLNKVLPV